jgi:lysozyme
VSSRILRALLALGLVTLGACASEEPSFGGQHEALRVCADGPTLDGIDVSKWQGTIDWDAVAADGVQFAFIRVSHGLLTYDEQYTRNWAEARRVGVLRGTYQFFQPDQDPIAQADLLLENMGTLAPDDLPPVIDVEAMGGLTGPQVTVSVQAWLDHVEAATGRTPIIYSGYYFWRDQVGEPPGFARYPLWIPQYGPVCPLIPDSWPRWDFFQTSSTGSIAGISGNVDTDLWNGTLSDLLAFANPGPACGDGLCSGGETATSCARDCPTTPDAGVPPVIDGGAPDADGGVITIDGGTTAPDGGAAVVDGGGASRDAGPALRIGGRLEGGCSCGVAPGAARGRVTLTDAAMALLAGLAITRRRRQV